MTADITQLEAIALAPAVEFNVGGKAALYQESAIDASGLWIVVQVLAQDRLKLRRVGGDDETIAHYSLLRPVDDKDRLLAELRKGRDVEDDLAAAEEGRAKCPRCGSPSSRLHPAVQSEGEVQLCSDPFHGPPPCDKHPDVTADQLDEGGCPSCIAERRAANERSRQKQEERERKADKRYVAGLAERARTIYEAMRDLRTSNNVSFGADISTALACALLVAERLDNIEEQLRQIGLSLDRMDR